MNLSQYLRKQVFAVAFYPLLFMAVCWAIFIIDQLFSLQLFSFGVAPRTSIGLRGIIFSPLLHANFAHIASNTFPILVLGSLFFYFYKRIAKFAILWIWLISGLWLWIGGRNSSDNPTLHAGASILIYGLASFLFFSGVFRKNLRLMIVSALVVFLYGSIMWGVLPIKSDMSWEGHLCGALAGLLVAYSYRKEGPQKKKYVWEDEDDSNEDPNQIQEWQIPPQMPNSSNQPTGFDNNPNLF
jgi:membrane associated rhomboid family serine protease